MKVSFLQTTDAKAWSGWTEKNHLGYIYQSQPQVADKVIRRMLSEAYGTSFSSLLDEIPALYLDDDRDYTWQLIGNPERNIPLAGAFFDLAMSSAIAASDTNVGAGGQRFYLLFDERWFSDVNVIVGELNELYPIQIVGDPMEVGSQFLYPVEAYGTKARSGGIPGEELVKGKRFSKEYSPVEDALSVKGGEVTYSAPITFRNTFSQIRMQYEAPGNINNDTKFGATFEEVRDGKKRTFTTWLEYQDWVFNYEFELEKNRLLYYGVNNRTDNGIFGSRGKSGRVIRAGAGIREQMEQGNRYVYSTFNADMLTNILLELSHGKLKMDQRRFVLRTGEYGAWLFHRAISDAALGWAPLFDQGAQRSASSPLHKNSRSWGFQYTEFMAPNGIMVTVEVDPMYDDPVRNKIMAPNTGIFRGGVAESYRMDIFDIGTVGGEYNIQKVYPKNNPDITAYIPGLRDPFSPTGAKAKAIASPKDGYSVHKFATCSAFIRDPQRCISLIPNILA